jgi:hypothetical protein
MSVRVTIELISLMRGTIYRNPLGSNQIVTKDKDKTRLQTMIGADLTRYLEIKAEMMGADALATAAKAILSEAMLREYPAIAQYLEIKERTQKIHDTTDND